MAAFESDAPIFSSFAAAYAIFSLYAYFGVSNDFDSL